MRSPGRAADSKSASNGHRAFEVVVASSPAAPRAARDAVSHWLTGHAGAQLLDDTLIVVSELVTNSVRHAGGRADDVIRVRAQAVNGWLQIEVEDAGRAGDVVRRPASRTRAGGIGLNIVDELAARWGVSRDRGCRQVWAELANPAGG
jgi:anti-sigma regulatory factor (Ser/Thr protein kinase)